MSSLTRTFRYYLLSFISFIISFIGIIGLRLTIVAVGIAIAHLSEKYIGKSGLTIGWIIGLVVGGILMMVLQKLFPYLERLDDYAKTHKNYPYTEKYGRDFPEPKSEDFGVDQIEFKEYNSRFQFEFIKLIFTYGLWIAGCIYTIQEKLKGSTAILLIGCTGVVTVLLHHLFNYWNKRISQRHRYHEKIRKYQEALGIYIKIRNENKNY